ncbi:MAG TPA: molecular chaperone DnaJ [Acidimicrobiia bacterium]|nr:molecular chaperone DnaJ [Acidimicrobiia bacterium]
MAPQREWLEKDYYAVLDVAKDADAKAVTKAYRKLARESHPDQNPDDPAAEERFKEISAAYDVVGDEDKRKEYDEVRALGPMGGGFGGGGGPGGVPFNVGDVGDLGDLLGGMFGQGARRTRRGGGAGPRRGRDLETDLHLSFDDAVTGVTTSVHLTSEAACSTCKGSGARPGTMPQPCVTCAGRGVVDDNQGFFSFSQPCPACSGRGSVIADPCPTCRGAGTEQRPREVKVRIPAGVDDGQRIRLKNRGEPGRFGGPAGDLFVRVHVAAHRLFERSGNNLKLAVPITFAEAALGADVRVPNRDGSTVTLRIPAGTQTGKTFRVKGRGVATKKRTGDLLVTVEVVVPKRLSREERKAVEALGALAEESPRAHLLPDEPPSREDEPVP